MMIENNVRVGCSIANFKNSNGASRSLMCCNYAKINMVGSKIYATAKYRPGEMCKSKQPIWFRGLCPFNERYE